MQIFATESAGLIPRYRKHNTCLLHIINHCGGKLWIAPHTELPCFSLQCHNFLDMLTTKNYSNYSLSTLLTEARVPLQQKLYSQSAIISTPTIA